MAGNGDSCQGTSVCPSSSNGAKAVFSRFWPAGMPFPPFAPWIAGGVSRAEAYAMMLAVDAADVERAVADGAPGAFDIIGRMMSDGGQYAAARKKKKKGRGGDPVPPGCVTQWNESCGVWQECCPQADGHWVCTPSCEGTLGGPTDPTDPGPTLPSDP